MGTEDDLSVEALNAHVFVTPTREAPMPNASQRGGRSSLPNRQVPQPLLHPPPSSKSQLSRPSHETVVADPFNQPLVRFSSWPAFGDENRSASFNCAPGLHSRANQHLVPQAFNIPRVNSYGVPPHMPKRINSYSIPQGVARVPSHDLSSLAGNAFHATTWPEIEQTSVCPPLPRVGREPNYCKEVATHLEKAAVVRQRSWQDQVLAPYSPLQRSLSLPPQKFSPRCCISDGMQAITTADGRHLYTSQVPRSPMASQHRAFISQDTTPERRLGDVYSPRPSASPHIQPRNLGHYPLGNSTLVKPPSNGHQDWNARKQSLPKIQVEVEVAPALIPSALQFDSLQSADQKSDTVHRVESITSSLQPAGYNRFSRVPSAHSDHGREASLNVEKVTSEVVTLGSSRQSSDCTRALETEDFEDIDTHLSSTCHRGESASDSYGPIPQTGHMSPIQRKPPASFEGVIDIGWKNSPLQPLSYEPLQADLRNPVLAHAAMRDNIFDLNVESGANQYKSTNQSDLSKPVRSLRKAQRPKKQDYSHMTVSELKWEIQRRGLDCLFCFSTADLVARLHESDEFMDDLS